MRPKVIRTTVLDGYSHKRCDRLKTITSNDSTRANSIPRTIRPKVAHRPITESKFIHTTRVETQKQIERISITTIILVLVFVCIMCLLIGQTSNKATLSTVIQSITIYYLSLSIFMWNYFKFILIISNTYNSETLREISNELHWCLCVYNFQAQMVLKWC